MIAADWHIADEHGRGVAAREARHFDEMVSAISRARHVQTLHRSVDSVVTMTADVPDPSTYEGSAAVWIVEDEDSGARALVTSNEAYAVVEPIRAQTKLETVVVTEYRDFLPDDPTLPPPPSFLESKARPAGTIYKAASLRRSAWTDASWRALQPG